MDRTPQQMADLRDYKPAEYCAEIGHSWVSGMMSVHPDDLPQVTKQRRRAKQPPPECGVCGHVVTEEDLT